MSIATVLLGRVVAFEGAEDQDLLFLGFDSEKSQNDNNLKKKRRVQNCSQQSRLCLISSFHESDSLPIFAECP